MKRDLHFTLVLLVLLFAESVLGQTRFNGTTMGPIEYNVTIADAVDDKSYIEGQVKQSLQHINQLMSTYIQASDVSRVNQASANEWIEVDPLTLNVVKRALELSKATRGAFDITVGPAVNTWKFGPDKNSGDSIPSDADIAELKAFVGYRLIETRDNPPSVLKQHENTEIDLSAIAKGFAVDQVAEVLTENNYSNFMVEVGGEVVAKGQAAGGRSWRIGIENPVPGPRQIDQVVNLNDQSLATSGDYRNFREINGKKYSHTINPATCRPVENQVASSAVIAADCMTADALATALMVLGPDQGLDVCRKLQAKCFIHSRADRADRSFAIAKSLGFPIEASEVQASDEKNSIWPAFVGALVVFGLAIAGMAVGAIFNKRPISGSCGGISATTNEDGSSSCSMCQKPVAECPENQESSPA